MVVCEPSGPTTLAGAPHGLVSYVVTWPSASIDCWSRPSGVYWYASRTLVGRRGSYTFDRRDGLAVYSKRWTIGDVGPSAPGTGNCRTSVVLPLASCRMHVRSRMGSSTPTRLPNVS